MYILYVKSREGRRHQNLLVKKSLNMMIMLIASDTKSTYIGMNIASHPCVCALCNAVNVDCIYRYCVQ